MINNNNYSKILYGSFVFLASYYIFFKQDYIEAASALGIALIFDPFDVNKAFNLRPMWQKAWLIIHLGLAAAALGYGIGIDG